MIFFDKITFCRIWPVQPAKRVLNDKSGIGNRKNQFCGRHGPDRTGSNKIEKTRFLNRVFFDIITFGHIWPVEASKSIFTIFR